MVRAMSGAQLKDRKRSTDLIFMLGLNETIDRLSMANSAHWNGRVFCQRKKGRPKRTWKIQVEGESVKVGLRREDALCRSKWSVGINQIAAGLR